MDEDVAVHEGRRVGVVVSVRLKPEEADLLELLSERDGRTMSETLRVALHYLATAPKLRGGIAMHGELGPFTRGGESRDVYELVGAPVPTGP